MRVATENDVFQDIDDDLDYTIGNFGELGYTLKPLPKKLMYLTRPIIKDIFYNSPITEEKGESLSVFYLSHSSTM